jgi:hypothetical protein
MSPSIIPGFLAELAFELVATGAAGGCAAFMLHLGMDGLEVRTGIEIAAPGVAGDGRADGGS